METGLVVGPSFLEDCAAKAPLKNLVPGRLPTCCRADVQRPPESGVNLGNRPHLPQGVRRTPRVHAGHGTCDISDAVSCTGNLQRYQFRLRLHPHVLIGMPCKCDCYSRLPEAAFAQTAPRPQIPHKCAPADPFGARSAAAEHAIVMPGTGDLIGEQLLCLS